MGVEKSSRTRPVRASFVLNDVTRFEGVKLVKNPPEIKMGRIYGAEHDYMPHEPSIEPVQPPARPWSTSFHPDFMRCSRCKQVGGWSYVAPLRGDADFGLYRCNAKWPDGWSCGNYRHASEPAHRVDFEIERDDILALYGVWHSHLDAETEAGRAIEREAYAALAQRMTFHMGNVYGDPHRLLVMSPGEVIAALLPNRMLGKPDRVHGLPERTTSDQKRALDRLAKVEAEVAAKARGNFGSRVLDEETVERNKAEHEQIAAQIRQRDLLRMQSEHNKHAAMRMQGQADNEAAINALVAEHHRRFKP